MNGLHLIADLHDCAPSDPDLMHKPQALRKLCLDAVDASGLSAVAELFHSFAPTDASAATQPPCGITGVVLLAESHCAVHTWPEKQAVTLDVYVCNFAADNRARARLLTATLIAAFAPGRHALKEVARGEPLPPPG